MRSIKTSSLVRRALAVSFGLALGSTAAYAGSISDNYNNGDTLTAAMMTSIKDAVNENDTRITTNTNAITTLNTTVSGHTTSINTLTTDVNDLKQNIATGSCGTGMTRVGPTCVDNTRGPNNTSWLNAVAACRTAGKRLLTPGEWVAAKQQGALTDAANDELEWIDTVAFNSTAPYGMFVGYMGTTADLSGGFAVFTNVDTSYADANIYYRCAR